MIPISKIKCKEGMHHHIFALKTDKCKCVNCKKVFKWAQNIGYVLPFKFGKEK